MIKQALSILEILPKAEVAEREVCYVKLLMKAKKFPVYTNIAGFEFNDNQVYETLVRALHLF